VLASRFHIDFLAPVYIGDTITCEAVVVEVSPKYKIRVDSTCTNEKGEAVIRGHFTGYPPDGEKLAHLTKGVGKSC
jgi:3-hydroxybutyryl-CoA dehydratase